MADIREIDMPQAKDANGKKIRLVGDDGKGYWMNFDDLAAVVGGRLPIVSLSKAGFSPASTLIRYNSGISQKWILIARATPNQSPVGLTGIVGTFSDRHCLFIRASLMSSNNYGIRFFCDGAFKEEYLPKFKYKSGPSGVYLWTNAGKVHINYNVEIDNVLIEQEPDEDAIEITGNIE